MLITLVICIAPVCVLAEDTVSVMVNEERVVFPDAQPFTDQNSRTQVPIKFIAEQLNATVKWVEWDNGVEIITQNNDIIYFRIGEKKMIVNGVGTDIDAPATTRNGRSFVPLKFVSEALGVNIEWVAKDNLVKISKKYTEPQYILTYEEELEVVIETYAELVTKIENDAAIVFEDKAATKEEYDIAIDRYKTILSQYQNDRDTQYYNAYKQLYAEYSRRGSINAANIAKGEATRIVKKLDEKIIEIEGLIQELYDEKEENMDFYDQWIQKYEAQIEELDVNTQNYILELKRKYNMN